VHFVFLHDAHDEHDAENIQQQKTGNLYLVVYTLLGQFNSMEVCYGYKEVSCTEEGCTEAQESAAKKRLHSARK
jgi:hypothetical protein